MEPIPIPRHIDEPLTLLIWQADEFVPFFIVILSGMLMGQLFAALIVSYFVLRAYRRFRDNRPDGIALDALYWWGILPTAAITRPNPWIRRFYP